MGQVNTEDWVQVGCVWEYSLCILDYIITTCSLSSSLSVSSTSLPGPTVCLQGPELRFEPGSPTDERHLEPTHPCSIGEMQGQECLTMAVAAFHPGSSSGFNLPSLTRTPGDRICVTNVWLFKTL